MCNLTAYSLSDFVADVQETIKPVLTAYSKVTHVVLTRIFWGISACSLEIIGQISQPVSNIFLSQKISQQYFQPARSAQTRLFVFAPFLDNYDLVMKTLANMRL
jgi:hypothetical protein